MSTASPQSSYQALAATLNCFGRFRKQWFMLHGLAWFLILGPGSLLAWFLLDWGLKLPAWPLVILFAVATAMIAWAAIWWLLRPALRRVNLEREALVAESLHERFDSRLIGSLQLGREALDAEQAGLPLAHSKHLVWALIGQTAEQLATARLTNLIDLRSTRRYLMVAAAVAMTIGLCAIFARAAVEQRVHRLQDAYAMVLDSLFPVELRVAPGDIAVVRGRPLTLKVEVIGGRRQQVRLVRISEKTKELRTDDLALDQRKGMLEIAKAQESFSYRFEYGGRKSSEYKVRVGDLPDVNAINYELAYPAYTGQPSRTLSGRVPKVQSLAGTGVLVSFAATTDLHSEYCYVEWRDGSRQPIATTGRFGHFSFTVGRPDRATIHLTGAYGRGFEMEQPISFEIGVQLDQPPLVKAELRNRKLTLLAEEAAAFTLPWLAEDDFGVTEVNLEYKIDTIDELLSRSPRQGAVPRRIEPSQDRVKGQFAEMFKSLDPPLQPGDRIAVVISAKDNNTETGPSLGRSLPLEIVVVRPDLAGFVELKYGFATQGMLGGLTKVKRATDLLIEPDKSVRTEGAQPIDKQDLKSRVSQESWPSGSEDAVGNYFRLLSGEK